MQCKAGHAKGYWVRQAAVFAISLGLLTGGCSQQDQGNKAQESQASKNSVQYSAVELQMDVLEIGKDEKVYNIKQDGNTVDSFSVSVKNIEDKQGLRVECILKHRDKSIHKEEECFGLSIKKAFKVGENLLLLLTFATGGNTCIVEYAFLTLKPNKEVGLSQRFDNCFPATEVRTEDGSILVKIPSYDEPKLFVYKDGLLEEKPDPEFAEPDAKTIKPKDNEKLTLELLKAACLNKVGRSKDGRLECKPCPSFTSFGKDSMIEDSLVVEEIYGGDFYPGKKYYIVRYSGCEPNSKGGGGYYMVEETKRGLRFVSVYNESAGKCRVRTKQGRDYLYCTLGECYVKSAGRLGCRFINLDF
ncbi:hypothetical protein [Hydrogenobacter thermophilus]|uniref:hypothetical protein n=1 Tax=Hydrogenobacter thermophilus TaxID=940 RepID=UPI001E64E4A3|nr:hypothetical protein [Hydrogenobacter thermophilus]